MRDTQRGRAYSSTAVRVGSEAERGNVEGLPIRPRIFFFNKEKKGGPTGLCDLCPGHSKLRELPVFHGIAFPDAEPSRTMETPHFFLRSALLLLLLYGTVVLSALKLSTYFAAATAVQEQLVVAFQALPFVTITDGTTLC